MRTLIAFLILCASAFGQALSEGSVTFMLILPMPGSSDVYDFNLCCGAPVQGGYLGDGFSYSNAANHGLFKLSYHRPGDADYYQLVGTIETWFYPTVVSKDCVIQDAYLTGVTMSLPTGQMLTNLVAEYTQPSCQRNGNFWLGPGGLTVHAP